jgi:hypothetical protein
MLKNKDLKQLMIIIIFVPTVEPNNEKDNYYKDNFDNDDNHNIFSSYSLLCCNLIVINSITYDIKNICTILGTQPQLYLIKLDEN